MNNTFYNAWIKTFERCVIIDINEKGNIKVKNIETIIDINLFLPKYYFMSVDVYKNMIDTVDNINKYNV